MTVVALVHEIVE
jgi:hypothetical protein